MGRRGLATGLVLHSRDHASDLLIQRDGEVQRAHYRDTRWRASDPKVTRSSRSGSMFVTEPSRGLTRHAMARKSHHADAHTWRRVFAAARHPIRADVAGESMHRTADRLPAARTWVWSAGAQCSGPTLTAALRLGGQEGAGRTWCLGPDPGTPTSTLIGEGLVESPGTPPAGTPPRPSMVVRWARSRGRGSSGTRSPWPAASWSSC